MRSSHLTITVIPSCTELTAQAQELAARLGLPMEAPESSLNHRNRSTEQGNRLLLRVTGKGLELVASEKRTLGGAVRVDFTAGHAAFRRKQEKKELLIRAVDGKNRASLDLIDATGGLGRDSFLLAAAGYRVHIFERHPVLATLLADGLERAAAHPETAEICQRIRLTAEDAVPVLKAGAGKSVDVVYLDPMFPHRRKSALVKKELQMLQLLVQPDSAPERLLAAALQAAGQRVVVKRPLKAPFLPERPPSHSLCGKTIRFDVYMTS